MPETNLYLLFTRKLNELGARYMVTGSVAAFAYGEPRLTLDVDIVVELEPKHVNRLHVLFPEPIFYCPHLEAIQVEVSRPRKGQFNIIHLESGFKADLYINKNDPLDTWGFQNAKVFDVAGERMTVAPAEYVIVRKLLFFKEGGSEKHLRDIRGMLAVSGKDIDMPDLEREIRTYGLEESWKKVKS